MPVASALVELIGKLDTEVWFNDLGVVWVVKELLIFGVIVVMLIGKLVIVWVNEMPAIRGTVDLLNDNVAVDVTVGVNVENLVLDVVIVWESVDIPVFDIEIFGVVGVTVI